MMKFALHQRALNWLRSAADVSGLRGGSPTAASIEEAVSHGSDPRQVIAQEGVDLLVCFRIFIAKWRLGSWVYPWSLTPSGVSIGVSC